MARCNYIILFDDVEMVTKKMTNEQVGMLIRAAFDYGFRGIRYSGDDIRVDQAFESLANQIDRDLQSRARRSKSAEARWMKVAEGCNSMQSHANDAPIQSNPVQSNPIQSNPIQNISNTLSPAGAAEKRAYGKYGWITLTDQEYAQLQRELGDQELKRCIRYVDESAQANGNRNGWQDFAVILTKCSREGWGVKKARKKKEEIPKGASGVLGEAELGFIQNALRGEV